MASSSRGGRSFSPATGAGAIRRSSSFSVSAATWSSRRLKRAVGSTLDDVLVFREPGKAGSCDNKLMGLPAVFQVSNKSRINCRSVLKFQLIEPHRAEDVKGRTSMRSEIFL